MHRILITRIRTATRLSELIFGMRRLSEFPARARILAARGERALDLYDGWYWNHVVELESCSFATLCDHSLAVRQRINIPRDPRGVSSVAIIL